MRLPRRVPWASIAELEHVCSSIYADENDIDAKMFAINRISAWRAITSLPHAVESTLALLVVIVQDADKQVSYPLLLLRQSYATAILRLVNGLVDPLQIGTYARPITSIAQQLGLPGWLVEIRHAATHEDLPSIDLLREAARQSMTWLLHNYYLPTLNPPLTTIQELEASPVRPLLPILKFYKETMKTITRDVSLVPRHRSKLITVLRDIERWIAECKVSTNVAVGGWSEDVDAGFKETWALERFCDSLATKGMLVPLSKKKRQQSECFHPSKASISFWELLLQHVQSMHTGFPYVLSRRFLSILFSSDSTTNGQQSDPSYETYLASWIVWAADTWGNSSPEYIDLRKETLSRLMKGILSFRSIQSQSPLFEMVKALSGGQDEFQVLTTLLLQPQTTTWDSCHLDIMNERCHLLQSTLLSVESNTEASTTAQKQTEAQLISIPGWRILDEKLGWKPCPIGVYYSQL